MKLVHHLVLALTLAIVVVLAAMAALMRHNEAALMEGNDREDLSSMGRALRPALVKTWNTDGRKAALSLLRYTDEQNHDVTLRWVPLSDPAAAPGVNLDPIRRGEEVFTIDDEDEGHLVLYVPVITPGIPAGALELTKSLRQENEFLTRSLQNMLTTGVVLAIVLGTCSLIFGKWTVGRPLQLLTEQARRVAEGDFSAKVEVQRNDELGAISKEMNRMADRLLAARNAVQAEHAARITTLEQLRHTDRLATVGELAAGIAHELGTPLSVVIGRAKLIASGEQAGGQAITSANVVAEQGERMARVIRQLLDFARRQPGAKVRTDVVPIARQTLSLLIPIAKRRGIEIKLEEPKGPEEAVVEVHQLGQALTNLVVNGIQSMRKGGILTVSVHENFERPPRDVDSPAGDYLALEVRDQGDGIEEELLPHVFDPFFTTKPIGEGTGLGLSVAYGIARDHGGWIDAVSRRGGGSTFVIHLPLAAHPGGP